MRRTERELVHFARFLVEVTFRRRAASGSEVQESGERFAAPVENIRSLQRADWDESEPHSAPLHLAYCCDEGKRCRLDELAAQQYTLA